MGRDVNRAVFARFITNTGAEAGFFIGIWGKAAYEFGGDPTALAVMTFLIAVSSVIGNVVGGVLVDRLDARRVLIAAEVVLVPAILGLLLADSLPMLLALAVFPFLLHGVEETAATSLPPALIAEIAVDGDDDPLVKVNARLESAGWMALVAGPGIGGLLASFLDLGAVFWFDAATSAVSVFLLLTVHLADRPELADDAHETGGLREVLAGLAIARRTPRIAMAMAIGGLLWFSFGAFVALEPLYFRDILGEGPEVIGYVNVVFGLGLFAGSQVVERSERRFGYVAALGLSAATAFGAMAYVGTSSLRIVIVGAMLWSVPLGMIFPIIRTLAQRAAPAGAVGRVMGAIAMAQNTMSIMPAAFVPYLATRLGVQGTLMAGALFPLLALPVLFGTARRLDTEAPPQQLTIEPTPQPGVATPLP